MKYDVFISSKSEDYIIAEQIYNFLISNGLKVFLASTELERLGEAEYALAIDNAIDNSLHMIVVASKVDNLNAKWVRYEWSTFANDKKSGYRDGNLITILSKDVLLENLPASIRHNQSFNFQNYRKHVLPYLKKEESDFLKKSTLVGLQSNARNDNYNDKRNVKELIQEVSKKRGCVISITLVSILLIVSIPIYYNSHVSDNNVYLSPSTNNLDQEGVCFDSVEVVTLDSINQNDTITANGSRKIYSVKGLPIEMILK